MKINHILQRELKNPEFAKNYRAEKERSASALALSYARQEAGLTRADLAKKSRSNSIYPRSH